MMRELTITLLAVSLVLIAGCSQLEDKSYLTPIPDATYLAYKMGSPIETKLQAVMAARGYLSFHMTVIGGPVVISAERLSLKDAFKKSSPNDTNPNYFMPPDTIVWLVIFQGEVQILPPDPLHTVTLMPPQHSCIDVILVASDGSPIEVGEGPCAIGSSGQR
jgi:hypothetical protein